jgi:hypothetical protein
VAEETSGGDNDARTPENAMGLVSNFAVIGGIACTVIYALTRLLALLIVLRGTKPEQRGELVRAVGALFHRRPQSIEPADKDSPGSTTSSGPS